MAKQDKPDSETGYNQPGVNPYLNTPPTELARKIKRVKDPAKKKQVQKALDAWRGTYGNPMAPGMTGGGGLGGVGGVGMGDEEAPDLPTMAATVRGILSELGINAKGWWGRAAADREDDEEPEEGS